MPQRLCASCGLPVYPDESVDHGTFILCRECDAELIDHEEENYFDEEWAHLNATDDEEEF